MKFYWNIIIGLAGCLVLLGGCAGDSGVTAAGDAALTVESSLAWPPDAAPVRTSSAYEVPLTGIEYSATGGNTALFGSNLAFVGGGLLPWAIYSLGDLTEDNELVSVAASFIETPKAEGDGTRLYFAIANYYENRWEWIPQPTAGAPWTLPAGKAADYRKDDVAHLAVVLNGPGSARLATLTFTREANIVTVGTPQNLTADDSTAQQVVLDWDDVPEADGYYVYRGKAPTPTSINKLITGVITESTYTDIIPTNGDYYFYYVTAYAANESSQSNVVKAWCAGDDLPAPINLAVESRGSDNFTVVWERVGAKPDHWALFIDTHPNFTMDSETMIESTIGGYAAGNTFFEIEPGVTYYWKLCAVGSPFGPYGRISEELTGTSAGYWTWGEVETIGPGQPPIRAVVGDGVIGVSYFNGFSVNFAIEDGSPDTWRVDTPLPETLEYFTDFQDLCYGGESFLVTSFAHDPGDCWSAEWNINDPPPAWNTARVHGTGAVGLGVPVSGLNPTAAASDTEFAISQFYLTDTDLLLHTRAIGDIEAPWTSTVIDGDFISGCTTSQGIMYQDDNLYILQTNNYIDELWIGDRDGDWNWQDVLHPDAPKLPKYHDLEWFNGEWYTPGLQTSEKDIYMVHGNALPWAASRLVGAYDDAGFDARLAVEGTEAIVIDRFAGQYNYAFYSDSWQFRPLVVPGVTVCGSGGDIVLLDGIPYLVFQDAGTNEIKIAKGTPPAS